jgi:signal transduction histidine kinase
MQTTMENSILVNTLDSKPTREVIQNLIGRLISAQEEERRRLARELHDGLSQQLAMLTVELGMLAQQTADGNPTLFEQITRLQGRVVELTDDLRHMTHELHPAALEHLGLIPALCNYCAMFSQAEGIQVSFQSLGSMESVPLEVGHCLFRITQEALRNVAKHASVLEAWVEVAMEGGEILLRIADKGVGFDGNAFNHDHGLGLISMRERAQLLSGTLMIKSGPGWGTCIDVRVPVKLNGLRKKNRNRS